MDLEFGLPSFEANQQLTDKREPPSWSRLYCGWSNARDESSIHISECVAFIVSPIKPKRFGYFLDFGSASSLIPTHSKSNRQDHVLWNGAWATSLKWEYWQMARHYCAESPIVQRKPTPEEIRAAYGKTVQTLLHRTCMSCSVASILTYTVQQLDITLRVREIASGDRCTPQALLATCHTA